MGGKALPGDDAAYVGASVHVIAGLIVAVGGVVAQPVVLFGTHQGANLLFFPGTLPVNQQFLGILFAPIHRHIQLDTGDVIGIRILPENGLHRPVGEGVVKFVNAHPACVEDTGLYLHACGGKHPVGAGVALQVLGKHQGLALLIFYGRVIAKAQP